MSYGPVAINSLTTSDMVAPGMPVFVSAVQIDNTEIELTVAVPVMDADGSNLSGLATLTVATAAMVDGVNPFENMSMTEILGLAGVQKVDVALTAEDAGQQKKVNVAIMNLGGVQAFAAACAD